MWSILYMTVMSLVAAMVSVFLKEEKICYKMVYIVFNHHQKLRWKVKIYIDEKLIFLKGVWHLKG